MWSLVTALALARSADWRTAVVLLAVAVWYAVMVPALAPGEAAHRDTRAACYLLGAIGLLVAATWLAPVSMALGSLLYSHAFWLLSRLWMAVTMAALTTLAAGLAVGWHVDRAVWPTVGSVAVTGFVIAIFIGVLTRRQVEQEEARDRLITQLRATRAELATAQRQAGAQRERERLARDIHDTLAQGFTSLTMLLQTARAQLDHDITATHRTLELAERTARDGLTEARGLVRAQPVGLDAEKLPDLVSRLVAETGELANFEYTVDTSRCGDPPAPVAGAIVRIAQEALANIRQHAGASHVWLALATGETTTMRIADDGRGFDVAAAAGFGLAGIRARVAELDGTVTIDSAAGRGTQIRVEIP